MCVSAVVLCAVPAILWGQEGPSSQSASSIAGYPFGGIDESLTDAANALLAMPTQAKIPADNKRVAELPPASNLKQQRDLQSGTWSNGHPRASMMRLNDLRPIVEPILRNRGVPADLAAVILVESGGRADALSPKGARGLWQLMPDTARRFGLRVDETRDERLDLFRSTDAAAQYLHDLYAQFGDWKLALAAYNTGEGNVSSAILRTHTQSFDELVSLRALPLETRNYVPRVLVVADSAGRFSMQEKDRRSTNSITVFAFNSQ
jgi:soluble lytic murein transglycosylase-like protein